MTTGREGRSPFRQAVASLRRAYEALDDCERTEECHAAIKLAQIIADEEGEAAATAWTQRQEFLVGRQVPDSPTD